MSWWQSAQDYERRYTRRFIADGCVQRSTNPFFHDLLGAFFPDEWTRREVFEWAKGKTALEVGSSILPAIVAFTESERIVIEPMADEFAHYIQGAKVYPYAAETVFPNLPKIDGVIISRNCIDHADDPITLMERILHAAAPGCWLLHWSDIWHHPEPDAGHRDVTPEPGDMRNMIGNEGFDIVHEFSVRQDEPNLIDYGCLARKR